VPARFIARESRNSHPPRARAGLNLYQPATGANRPELLERSEADPDRLDSLFSPRQGSRERILQGKPHGVADVTEQLGLTVRQVFRRPGLAQRARGARQ
jgi:hypothetical protein